MNDSSAHDIYKKLTKGNEIHHQNTDVHNEIVDFEKKLESIRHQKCPVCRAVKLVSKKKLDKDGSSVAKCDLCKRKNFTEEDMLSILPVWYDKFGSVCYHLPQELIDLREGEKLIIAPYLVYVPLQHLKKGQLACQGHVCCFPQDVASFSSKLPRLPKDTHLIKVVRRYKDDNGSIKSKDFSIRRHKVAEALTWLKNHSKAFEQIEIDLQNLNWMEDDEEKELPAPCHEEQMNPSIDENGKGPNDLGPSPSQYSDVLADEEMENITCGGYRTEPCMKIGVRNKKLSQQISNAVSSQRKNSSNVIIWPHVDNEAVSEYEETDLFPKAFPWLFPGGIGDYKQYHARKLEMKEWIQILLRYEDGRFAKDKMWTFYVLNYLERHRSQSKGSFFVKCFSSEPMKTFDDIVKEIQEGNMTWIDKISYFTGQVKGSPSYWRNKRNEVNSWINHHIKLGHGPPTYFITLSCAEYWWRDIENLMIDRFKAAGLPHPPIEKRTKVKVINEYTIVVQEYFQHRVKHWLATVGKNIFKIKHYWCRFEFAPSRGQVHAHLLAISEHNKFFKVLNQKVPQQHKADVLAFWAKDNLGLTNDCSEQVILSTTS